MQDTFIGYYSVLQVVYVTATLPYLMMFVMLIRGLTLPGAAEGIKFYLTPDFSRLGHFSVSASVSILNNA